MSILENWFFLIAFIAPASRHTILAMTLASGTFAATRHNAIRIAITFDATTIHIIRHPEISRITFFTQITHVAWLTNASNAILLKDAASGEIALRFRARTRLTTNSIWFTVVTFSASFAFGAASIITTLFTLASLFVTLLTTSVAIARLGAANEALNVDDCFVDQQCCLLFVTIVPICRIFTRCAIVRGRTSAHFNTDGYIIRWAGQKDTRA